MAQLWRFVRWTNHDRNSADFPKEPKNSSGKFSSVNPLGSDLLTIYLSISEISANEDGDATQLAEDLRFRERINTLKRAKDDQGLYCIPSFDLSPVLGQIPLVVKQTISTEFTESEDRSEDFYLAITGIEQTTETSLKVSTDQFDDRLKELVEHKSTQSHAPATSITVTHLISCLTELTITQSIWPDCTQSKLWPISIIH